VKLNFDIVIVGAGISGMTAAIYLKRANISVAIVEDTAPGGQINRTNKIENYPGYIIIDGPTLAFNVFSQLQNLQVPYKYGKVLEVINNNEYKTIKTDKEEITCKSVIIATGRRPKELGLPNEKQLMGKGISWCAICDGALYKDLDVAVVGNDEKAIEEALYLSELCSKVTVISEKELETNHLKENIEIIENATIKSINGTDKLESIDIASGNVVQNIKVNALFIVLGRIPSTEMLINTGVELKDGYVVVDKDMKTNVEGIYACGDVISKSFYQITISIGEGATAALKAVKDLS